MAAFDIEISEVGPRDGLQSIQTIMPLEAKKAWIKAEFEAGVPEIEVGSFVPAKLLPQMADTAALVDYARTLEGLTIAALVPNFRGAQNAIDAGAHKISIPLSVSETHSLKNVNRTHDQMIEEVTKIAAYIQSLPKEKQPFFEGSLSTAFGCTIEGPIATQKVTEIAERLMKAGVNEVGLSDTTGYATPNHLVTLIKAVKSAVGEENLTGLHLHNTRGVGLANVVVALENGITTFDASLGGLGGCPFAPGASGNIVTEDLVYMLDSMGLKTGIDLEKLCAVRDIVQKALPQEELYGFLPHAGLPKGYPKGYQTTSS
ncbi:hydroxymethylglutaryl-CoA lyase [Temperatibacter marinus]|uniref:Hydroxymethylglutaryl-CoA lyase n=1 Tax=Temperatibacter marinus TaxID=1456591 RepID=A0AA52EF01_9PROT|nr:hydroxymethylglutaryl-CoA lyase [Temperatibacter marinus]WND03510.1 hydroxymethylglutaryl-CoA lyase [Temperatibacter marinus]